MQRCGETGRTPDEADRWSRPSERALAVPSSAAMQHFASRTPSQSAAFLQGCSRSADQAVIDGMPALPMRFSASLGLFPQVLLTRHLVSSGAPVIEAQHAFDDLERSGFGAVLVAARLSGLVGRCTLSASFARRQLTRAVLLA